jgi:small subunit ribosomal protein S7
MNGNDRSADRPRRDSTMPRRREIPKRDLAADALYNSSLVTKFINTIMKEGKRSTAERILYQSFDIIKERSGDDPLKIFKKAVDNVKPALEVKSRRVGGSNYQVPIEVNPNRRLSLSIRWLVSYARSRGDGKTMQEKLANELLDAANLRGGAVKKREDTHRMAEANKAFAHYRW